ncbi:metallophosphoesterase [Tahibacter sp.]|uniref:metallophosphoesterase n=1 Tax=Tahibacter sp. TaxID=2056211 RepID=UPI0028C3842D|nr:metallophosphoesterase [Tahibacter sp.]
MAKRLRILHLSDLHVGKEAAADHWRVERVMGDAWAANLREIAAEGAIDLVCFTGDLAQRGKPEEYHRVRYVIDAVLQSVNCPRERFFCVPGNHDIDRDIAPDAWSALRALQWQDPQGLSRWMVGGPPPFRCNAGWRDDIVRRQQAYRDFLVAADLAHLLPQQSPHGLLGYRRTLDVGAGAPLHIVGFDSAWLAGDDNDARKLRLGDDQIGRLLTGADSKALAGWRIGLIHHPLTDLADERDAQRLLGECGLDLLLHGHQHDPVIERRSDPQAGLSILAAGCLYEHQRYPNGLLVVDVDLPVAQPLRLHQVWARRWSHRRAEWIDDNELYRGTRNGRLRLAADNSVAFAVAPGELIGRDTELETLRAALLPKPATGVVPRPTAICCAIDGMPGVGKTRLAEQFISDHWLRVYPPPQDTLRGEAVVRLVLPPGAAPSDVRNAGTLRRDLADRLRLPGTGDELPAALRHGPGGHPRLLLIENVDSVAQAEQVAALVFGLPGCPVLVTARVRQWSGAGWKRVDVKPLRLDHAVALLRSEAAAAGDGACIPSVGQAEQLANTLGCLPLALHIAASHMSLGMTPDEFLNELRATGLDLAPAQPGDHGLQVDRARAILRSSFDLSWQAWCAGAGARAEWQQALVALAHGPADGVGESLGAAITELSAAQYGLCLVAAGRLSLLEWVWTGDADTRERRVRLHPLIAEFLRARPQPAAETVWARMGAWFAPRVSEADADAMGKSRREVQSEIGSLSLWLGRTRLTEAAFNIVTAANYAVASGPYGAWLACFAACVLQAGETQRGFDLMWAVTRLAQESGDPQLALETAVLSSELAKRLENEHLYAVAQGQIADILEARGELEAALRIRWEEQMPVYERLGDVRSRAITYGQIADILRLRGELEEALRIRREEQIPVFERLGDVRSRASAQGKIADILWSRGELEAALRIRREEELPVYERLGDMRERATTHGKIADILQVQGKLEEALRIRWEEQMPVYELLGDVRSRANTQGKIADILQLRGELEAALRIRREEELPVYERLGEVLALAITKSKIADILEAWGELEEALRIRREEALPVYERLGDARSWAITQGKIADILSARGELEEALRIRQEEQMPVFARVGAVQELAVAQGRIADILEARGELEAGLRIRREEELPVYERLGDVRSWAITQGKIAEILSVRGELEEALRIVREEELPVYERLGDVRSLLVGRTNLAMALAKRGRPEDGPEILTLLQQALTEAERLRLPEANSIRSLIARNSRDGDDGTSVA